MGNVGDGGIGGGEDDSSRDGRTEVMCYVNGTNSVSWNTQPLPAILSPENGSKHVTVAFLKSHGQKYRQNEARVMIINLLLSLQNAYLPISSKVWYQNVVFTLTIYIDQNSTVDTM